ncbi:MAG: hypothetical protein ACLFTE_10670 [Salinivenus sp.]
MSRNALNRSALSSDSLPTPRRKRDASNFDDYFLLAIGILLVAALILA